MLIVIFALVIIAMAIPLVRGRRALGLSPGLFNGHYRDIGTYDRAADRDPVEALDRLMRIVDDSIGIYDPDRDSSASDGEC